MVNSWPLWPFNNSEWAEVCSKVQTLALVKPRSLSMLTYVYWSLSKGKDADIVCFGSRVCLRVWLCACPFGLFCSESYCEFCKMVKKSSKIKLLKVFFVAFFFISLFFISFLEKESTGTTAFLQFILSVLLSCLDGPLAFLPFCFILEIIDVVGMKPFFFNIFWRDAGSPVNHSVCAAMCHPFQWILSLVCFGRWRRFFTVQGYRCQSCEC